MSSKGHTSANLASPSLGSILHSKKSFTTSITFENLDSLVDFINSEWRKITSQQCEAMIDNIPKPLSKVIQFNGNQLYEH